MHVWQETEIELAASGSFANPYVDVEVWADFQHESGTTVRRPAFWDGGSTWRIRFASPGLEGAWTWRSGASVDDDGLAEKTGDIEVDPAGDPANRFRRHGFWRMSPRGRCLVHADGYPAILAGDTAWALPWRATEEQVRVYAADRQRKGFNAVLLMSVQPDMGARGPRDRTADEGFDVGFEDLPTGHINQPNPPYFQYLDRLVDILVEHEIVPVWQPVFFGFGWKGKKVAGPVLPPREYARYCRYLVARYGARPAIYLVGGDGSGYEPQVAAGGEEVERWDAYAQPTGIHYRPHSNYRAHQNAEWLDFQWCQTGHSGEHLQDRVADMRRNTPAKAVANGEPTYERIGGPRRAAGWWQGHEAWSNLLTGGTMGVVYGAGSMWQWRLHPGEPGHPDFFIAEDAGWREALDFEGSRYVGLVPKILEGLPTTDAEPNREAVISFRCLLVPHVLCVVFLSEGGRPHLVGDQAPLGYRVIDPKSGEVVLSGDRSSHADQIPDTGDGPRVVIFHSGGES